MTKHYSVMQFLTAFAFCAQLTGGESDLKHANSRQFQNPYLARMLGRFAKVSIEKSQEKYGYFGRIPEVLMKEIIEFVGPTWKPVVVKKRYGGLQQIVRYDDKNMLLLWERALEIVCASSLQTQKTIVNDKDFGRNQSCVVLPDGRVAVASISLNSAGMSPRQQFSKLFIWNMHDTAHQPVFTGSFLGLNCCFALLGDKIVYKSPVNNIHVWNSHGGQRPLESYCLISCLLAMENNILVYGFEDGTIELLNVDTKKLVLMSQDHKKKVTALVALSSSQFASGSEDGSIKLWNIAKDIPDITLIIDADITTNIKSPVTALAVLPKNKLAAGYVDTMIRIWDCSSSKCVSILKHPSRILSLATTPSNQLVSASVNGTIVLWGETGLDIGEDRGSAKTPTKKRKTSICQDSFLSCCVQ